MDIKTASRNELEDYFKNGDKPNQTQFKRLIQGMLNMRDDGLFKSADVSLSVASVDGPDTSRPVLRLFESIEDKDPQWVIGLQPRTANQGQTTTGLDVSGPDAKSRLFIDATSGNIGVGTTQPAQPLVVSTQPIPYQNTLGRAGQVAINSDIPQLDFIGKDMSWAISADAGVMAFTAANPMSTGFQFQGDVDVSLNLFATRLIVEDAQPTTNPAGEPQAQAVISGSPAQMNLFDSEHGFGWALATDETENENTFNLLYMTGEATPEAKLTITKGGFLGVGTSSPNALVDVANYNLNNTPFQGLLRLTANQSQQSLSNSFDEAKPAYGIEFHRQWNSDDQQPQAGIYAWGAEAWGSGLAFRTRPTNPTPPYSASLHTRMVITDDGHVGIGTLEPKQPLVVRDSLSDKPSPLENRLSRTGQLAVGSEETAQIDLINRTSSWAIAAERDRVRFSKSSEDDQPATFQFDGNIFASNLYDPKIANGVCFFAVVEDVPDQIIGDEIQERRPSNGLSWYRNYFVNFSLVFQNAGDAFDEQTSTFTAPIDGIYQFQITLVPADGSGFSIRTAAPRLDINGENAYRLPPNYDPDLVVALTRYKANQEQGSGRSYNSQPPDGSHRSHSDYDVEAGERQLNILWSQQDNHLFRTLTLALKANDKVAIRLYDVDDFIDRGIYLNIYERNPSSSLPWDQRWFQPLVSTFQGILIQPRYSPSLSESTG